MQRMKMLGPAVGLVIGLAPAVAGPAEAPEVAAPVGCTVGSPPAAMVVELSRGVERQRLGPAEAVRLEVANLAAMEGQASLDVTVFSEHGLQTREGVVALELAPGARSEVAIPAAGLGLPESPLRSPALVTITGRIGFPDGSERRLDVPLVLRLDRQGEGWSLRRPADGQGETASGPAHVVRRAADGRWTPPLDGPPDPDARQETGPVTEEHRAPMFPLKFCIDVVSTYTDAGVGEDFWQSSSPTARAARGFYAYVWRDATNTSPAFSGWLGDGFGADDPGVGCTTELSGYETARPYYIRVDSRARVQDNSIYASDAADDIIRTHTVFAGNRTWGTFTVTVSPTDEEFNVAMAGAYAIYRHAGGMTLKTYNFKDNYTGNNHFDRFENRIYITSSTLYKKFILVHETGHAIGEFGTGDQEIKLVGIGCEDFDGTPFGCAAAGGSHSMGSKELAKCALGEGWAHFYAADVFNDHDQTDCFYHYYKNEFGTDADPTVNCEAANGGFVLRYMESNCDPPYGGYGTELDWLRALWDLHTDPTDAPGFTEILQFMDSAGTWGPRNAFDLLDREADAIGGQLDSHWDVAKSYNGIDWASGVVFEDDFENNDTQAWSSTVP